MYTYTCLLRVRTCYFGIYYSEASNTAVVSCLSPVRPGGGWAIAEWESRELSLDGGTFVGAVSCGCGQGDVLRCDQCHLII